MVDSVLVNKPGFGGKAVYYSMVFFKDRLVLAYVGEDSWKKMIVKEAIGELGLVGTAVNTAIEARSKVKSKQDPSQSLAPSAYEEAQLIGELLAANPKKNYAIAYDQIEIAEVKKSGIRDALAGDSEAIGRITLKMKSEEQKFYIRRRGKEKFEDAERIFTSYLAEKMGSDKFKQ